MAGDADAVGSIPLNHKQELDSSLTKDSGTVAPNLAARPVVPID